MQYDMESDKSIQSEMPDIQRHEKVGNGLCGNSDGASDGKIQLSRHRSRRTYIQLGAECRRYGGVIRTV